MFSAAAVAVAVIRDNLRPNVTDEIKLGTIQDYLDLMTNSWHADPTIRPTFLEIMTRLSALMGESQSHMTTSVDSSSSADSSSSMPKMSRQFTATSDGDVSLRSGFDGMGLQFPPRNGVQPPEGEVTIVFSDITRAASLWEFHPIAMRDATLLHNEKLRSLLVKHSGYEVISNERNSGEGSFCLAFQSPNAALEYCMHVQSELLQLPWPEQLLDHPGAAEVITPPKEELEEFAHSHIPHPHPHPLSECNNRNGATLTTGCCTRACAFEWASMWALLA
jgi:hypothetical protein